MISSFGVRPTSLIWPEPTDRSPFALVAARRPVHPLTTPTVLRGRLYLKRLSLLIIETLRDVTAASWQ